MKNLKSILQKAENAKQKSKFAQRLSWDEKFKMFNDKLKRFCEAYKYELKCSIYVTGHWYSFDTFKNLDGKQVFEAHCDKVKFFCPKAEKLWQKMDFPKRGKGWKLV